MAGNNEQNSRVARRKSQPKPPKKHWFRRIILSLAALFDCWCRLRIVEEKC